MTPRRAPVQGATAINQKGRGCGMRHHKFLDLKGLANVFKGEHDVFQ